MRRGGKGQAKGKTIAAVLSHLRLTPRKKPSSDHKKKIETNSCYPSSSGGEEERKKKGD